MYASHSISGRPVSVRFGTYWHNLQSRARSAAGSRGTFWPALHASYVREFDRHGKRPRCPRLLVDDAGTFLPRFRSRSKARVTASRPRSTASQRSTSAWKMARRHFDRSVCGRTPVFRRSLAAHRHAACARLVVGAAHIAHLPAHPYRSYFERGTSAGARSARLQGTSFRTCGSCLGSARAYEQTAGPHGLAQQIVEAVPVLNLGATHGLEREG